MSTNAANCVTATIIGAAVTTYKQPSRACLVSVLGSCIEGVGGSLNLHLDPRAPLGTISFPAVCDLASAVVGLRHSAFRLALLSCNNLNTEEL